jgi:hypothetical protein
VVVVHDDRRDRLDAPVDPRRAEAECAAAAHADRARAGETLQPIEPLR